MVLLPLSGSVRVRLRVRLRVKVRVGNMFTVAVAVTVMVTVTVMVMVTVTGAIAGTGTAAVTATVPYTISGCTHMRTDVHVCFGIWYVAWVLLRFTTSRSRTAPSHPSTPHT